jgi:hypothetical protein
MKAEASRRIRERKNMKLAKVNDALTTIFPPAGGPLVWRLQASAAPMPLFAFGARQTKRGVSVEVNRGKRTIIPGTFIATMKSGHTGVFYRQGKARLPIDEAYSTRISEAFWDAREAIAERGITVLRSTFDRVLATKPWTRSG